MTDGIGYARGCWQISSATSDLIKEFSGMEILSTAQLDASHDRLKDLSPFGIELILASRGNQNRYLARLCFVQRHEP